MKSEQKSTKHMRSGEECSSQRGQPARGLGIQRDPDVWRNRKKFTESSRGQGGRATGVDLGKEPAQRRRAFIQRTNGK